MWTLADPDRSPSGRNQGGDAGRGDVVDGQDMAGTSWYRPRSERVRPVLARRRSSSDGIQAAQRGQRKHVAYHRRARLSRRSLRTHLTPTRSTPEGAEPTSRRTVKSEGRDPLYGRRRLLASRANGHPSSIPPDSAGRPGPGGMAVRWLSGRDLLGRGDPGLLPEPVDPSTITRMSTAIAHSYHGTPRRDTKDGVRSPVVARPTAAARRRTPVNPIGRLDQAFLLTHLLCCRHSPRNLRPVGATGVFELA